MRAARLAAHCSALLGPISGPILIACPGAPRLAAVLAARVLVAGEEDVPAGALVSFLGTPARPAERQALLRSFQRRLPARAPVLLVDHNQPRAVWRRLAGFVCLSAARLRRARARYPAARELAALGFAVECLRLTCGERVQLVLARRR